jgi:ACS family pantothenate transporter-like MFS transporter
VGSGVSAIDIAKEISSVAKQIYQVSRGGKFDLPGDMLPPNAVRVGEIESFNLLDGSANISEKDPIPGTVTLVDGTILKDIDRVILCTGYHMSLPFLQAYHRDELEPSAADTTVLITDGSQMHNLYHDIFYIPDPSLAFIGVPFYTATFTLFEFQAITVAKLFAGQASFPPQEQMRNEFNERVRERGFGKSYHSLMGEEAKYVDGLVAWINGSPGIAEQDLMKGHTEEWHISRASFVSGRSKEKAALLEIKDSALSAVS